uniref:Uncharacterized protein n=1 Tax=Vespula pensylvanica TaxID=30213 RepID=A0A834P083_VESPE|nr:hypothetical protein H0235_008566 [Vespula pensylvanica]
MTSNEFPFGKGKSLSGSSYYRGINLVDPVWCTCHPLNCDGFVDKTVGGTVSDNDASTLQIGKGPSLIVDYETGVTVLDDAGLKWRRRSKRDEGESSKITGASSN